MPYQRAHGTTGRRAPGTPTYCAHVNTRTAVLNKDGNQRWQQEQKLQCMGRKKQRQKLDIGDDTILSFDKARISGSVFVELTEADLKEIVKPLGDRKSIMKLIRSYQPTRVSS